MSKTTSTRLHSLDAVRGGALLLGIFFHAAFSFFPGDQFWLVVDSQRSEVVSGTAYVLHIFRMTIFFVLAGYFARMQTYRLGTGSFMRDRLKRIGIPLVFFWPIMMASFIALAIWGMIHANGGTMPENPPPPPPPMTLQNFPLTHLWFLYVLLVFYAVSLTLRRLLSVIRARGFVGNASDQMLHWVNAAGVLPIVLALPTAAAFILQPMWHPFFGIPTPEYGFVPNPIASVAYGTAFTIGWLLQRNPEHLRRAIRLWPVYLGAAIALTAYCISQIGLNVTYMQAIPEGGKTLYSVAYSLAIWTWTFGLIGLCTKMWSRESAVRRYIADASYWLYLIHLPVVMGLQVWVSQWALLAEIKYVLILGLSIPFMLLTYELLVRYTFIGWILNGKKRSRKKQKLAEIRA
jgi:glucan biosynthesis protein C